MRPGVAPFPSHGWKRNHGSGSWPRAAAALAIAALAVSGCGGASAAPEKAGAGRPGDASANARPSGGPAAAPATVPCPASLHEFVAGLETLRRRLVGGLTYEQYVGAVKGLRARYAAIPIETMPSACLLATGAPSERAFDLYVEAANAWGRCLSEPGCDAGDVEAPLQAEWRVASRQLDALRRR